MLRGRPGAATVLVVTPTHELVESLAEAVSRLGHYAFASTPPAVTNLFAFARFDIVVVLGDLEPAERERIDGTCAALHPQYRGTLVHAKAARAIEDVVEHHLPTVAAN